MLASLVLACVAASHDLQGRLLVQNIVDSTDQYQFTPSLIRTSRSDVNAAIGIDRTVHVTNNDIQIRKLVSDTVVFETALQDFWGPGTPELFNPRALYLEDAQRFVVSSIGRVFRGDGTLEVTIAPGTPDEQVVLGVATLSFLGDFDVTAPGVLADPPEASSPLANAADMEDSWCIVESQEFTLVEQCGRCIDAGAVGCLVVRPQFSRFMETSGTPGGSILDANFFDTFVSETLIRVRRLLPPLESFQVVAVSQTPYPETRDDWLFYRLDQAADSQFPGLGYQVLEMRLSAGAGNIYFSHNVQTFIAGEPSYRYIVGVSQQQLLDGTLPQYPATISSSDISLVTEAPHELSSFLWLDAAGTQVRTADPSVDCTPTNVTFFVAVDNNTSTRRNGVQHSLQVYTVHSDGSTFFQRVHVGLYGAYREDPDNLAADEEIGLNNVFVGQNGSPVRDYYESVLKVGERCVLQQLSLWCVLSARVLDNPAHDGHQEIIWVELDVHHAVHSVDGTIHLKQRGTVRPSGTQSAFAPALELDQFEVLHLTYLVAGPNAPLRTEHTFRFASDPHDTLRMPPVVSVQTIEPYRHFQFVSIGNARLFYVHGGPLLWRHPIDTEHVYFATECPSPVIGDAWVTCLTQHRVIAAHTVASSTYISPTALSTRTAPLTTGRAPVPHAAHDRTELRDLVYGIIDVADMDTA